MFNARSTFSIGLRNQKGQIAIFVALIFQVLFLFFAMVINVGLLVHHKINLQNSVDLAAYYGAMKQAQTMNAIAHTNYQIRQSWKLLAWRYRMIGSAGDWNEHPFDKLSGQLRNADVDGINPAMNGFYDAPSFCITYAPFKPVPAGENTCRDVANSSGVVLFKVPNPTNAQATGGVLDGLFQNTRNLTQNMLNQAVNRCQITGPINFLTLGLFVVSFIQDQKARSELISTLARSITPNNALNGEFLDLDGKNVLEGVRSTLSYNLTAANESTLNFSTYNSLGADGCNANGLEASQPPRWLSPIKILPAFNYVDMICQSGGAAALIPAPKALVEDPNFRPQYTKNPPNLYANEINKLAQYIGGQSNLNSTYNYSVGVEKNPWCMAYFGVSASTNPKIPFSPFGAVNLKARAFYKPFGGRIGPWYSDRWPKGAPRSSGGAKVDRNYPPRVEGSLPNIANLSDAQKAPFYPNYSRFVGDLWGLKSRRVLGQYGAAIYKLDPNWSSKVGQMNLQADYSDAAPNIEHWGDLPFDFVKKGGSQDLLAWDHKQGRPSRFRLLEMTAILPDPFDLAYYSIEPDFYNNYYKKIRDGLLAGKGASYYSGGAEFLGDIGSRSGSSASSGKVNWSEFSVKDQYFYVDDNLKNGFLKDISFDVDTKLTYISKKWMDVLTSWAPISLKDYALDIKKFGKCNVYPMGVLLGGSGMGEGTASVPTSGNCVSGGSTGYSVKMVHSEYLKRNHQDLGGSGQNGSILNPPPDDF